MRAANLYISEAQTVRRAANLYIIESFEKCGKWGGAANDMSGRVHTTRASCIYLLYVSH